MTFTLLQSTVLEQLIKVIKSLLAQQVVLWLVNITCGGTVTFLIGKYPLQYGEKERNKNLFQDLKNKYAIGKVQHDPCLNILRQQATHKKVKVVRMKYMLERKPETDR